MRWGRGHVIILSLFGVLLCDGASSCIKSWSSWKMKTCLSKTWKSVWELILSASSAWKGPTGPFWIAPAQTSTPPAPYFQIFGRSFVCVFSNLFLVTCWLFAAECDGSVIFPQDLCSCKSAASLRKSLNLSLFWLKKTKSPNIITHTLINCAEIQ